MCCEVTGLQNVANDYKISNKNKRDRSQLAAGYVTNGDNYAVVSVVAATLLYILLTYCLL